MRRVSTPSSSGNGSLSPMDRLHLSSQQHIVHGPWNRKSITTILSQQHHAHTANTYAEPSYSLWDLISVGVGGTVGSGIFVLTGYINNHYAGPATFLSFVVSGLAALCSGISFAEFSGRLPRIEGSTYT
jgi:amino acid permease